MCAEGATLRTLTYFLLITIFISPVFAQQNQQPQRSKLEKAADKLMVNPNSAKNHFEVAKAYFQRGAEGDAQRVNRHMRRAIELAPTLEGDVQSFLNSASSGFRTEPRTNEERVLDDQIQSTFPVGKYRDPDSIIKNGLAQRMARREFRAPSEDFDENLSEVKNLFGKGEEDDSEEVDWRDRMAIIAEDNAALGGWRRAFRRALRQAARQTNELRSSESRFATGTTSDNEDEQVIDPVQLKNEAFLHYMEGDMDKCVERLFETVAASESLQVQRSAASMSWDNGDGTGGGVEINPPSWNNNGGSVTGGQGQGGTPTPGALGGSGSQSATPGQQGAVPDVGMQGQQGQQAQGTGVGGGNLPPGMNRQIADTALESLEALGNKEVPPGEAGTKITELGAIGTVGEPLLIDLDENGAPNIHSTLIPDNQFSDKAVRFDLDGDGHAELVEWVSGGDGLLAMDLNGDGVISSGNELFGTALGHQNGYHCLSRLDIDGNGWVEGKEALELLLWRDNGDGLCQKAELSSLEDNDIEAISCRPKGLAGKVKRAGSEIACWEWLPEMRP